MDIGQILFGFGLLFVGINIMGDVMKPLAHAKVFIDMIGLSNLPGEEVPDQAHQVCWSPPVL